MLRRIFHAFPRIGAAAMALGTSTSHSQAACGAAAPSDTGHGVPRQHFDDLFDAAKKREVSMAGRTALITGASSGIGKATACAFAAEGINLILVARRGEKLLEIKDEVERRGLGVSVSCIAGDCCDEAVYRQLREQELVDKIDILVANAGCALGKDAVTAADPADWRGMMDANCYGAFRVIREVVPSMVRRGEGTVIGTGSIAGLEAYEGGSVYCASKFAMHAFMKALRYETHAKGIRVAVVAPGAVGEGTEFSEVRFKGDAALAAKTYDRMQELKATDVAMQMLWIVKQPSHVNLDQIVLMPTCQGGATRIHRG